MADVVKQEEEEGLRARDVVLRQGKDGVVDVPRYVAGGRQTFQLVPRVLDGRQHVAEEEAPAAAEVGRLDLDS